MEPLQSVGAPRGYKDTMQQKMTTQIGPGDAQALDSQKAASVSVPQSETFGTKCAPRGSLLRRLAERWYEGQLLKGVTAYPPPQHVALILDGNRRFATRSKLSRLSDGHRFGAEKVRELVRWCDELAIPTVTVWGLSTDNLQRAPEEIAVLFGILGEALDLFSQGEFGRRRVRVLGRLELLPPDLQRRISELEAQSASNGAWAFNIALAYGGRDEVVDCVRRMLRSKADGGATAVEIADSLTADDLSRFLYVPDMPDPDLIIRTSGEARLSGFLLWQSVYSELYFCDSLWPAFRKLDFLRAIRSFQARQRRFGR